MQMLSQTWLSAVGVVVLVVQECMTEHLISLAFVVESDSMFWP